jgi:hypothetical protein
MPLRVSRLELTVDTANKIVRLNEVEFNTSAKWWLVEEILKEGATFRLILVEKDDGMVMLSYRWLNVTPYRLEGSGRLVSLAESTFEALLTAKGEVREPIWCDVLNHLDEVSRRAKVLKEMGVLYRDNTVYVYGLLQGCGEYLVRGWVFQEIFGTRVITPKSATKDSVWRLYCLREGVSDRSSSVEFTTAIKQMGMEMWIQNYCSAMNTAILIVTILSSDLEWMMNRAAKNADFATANWRARTKSTVEMLTSMAKRVNELQLTYKADSVSAFCGVALNVTSGDSAQRVTLAINSALFAVSKSFHCKSDNPNFSNFGSCITKDSKEASALTKLYIYFWVALSYLPLVIFLITLPLLALAAIIIRLVLSICYKGASTGTLPEGWIVLMVVYVTLSSVLAALSLRTTHTTRRMLSHMKDPLVSGRLRSWPFTLGVCAGKLYTIPNTCPSEFLTTSDNASV